MVVPDGDSYQFVRITFPHGGVRKWTNVTNYREIPNDEGVTVMFNGVDEDGNTVAVNLSLTPGGMIEKGPPM